MEEKTTANGNELQEPLINDRRASMELEQATVETQANAKEPFWFKVLCFLGGVYPIVRENGKCHCNCKAVCWSILPSYFSGVCCWVISRNDLLINVFSKIWCALLLIFQLSLSYSRKPFSDAVVGEENRLYLKTYAASGVMIGVMIVVIIVVISQGGYLLGLLPILCQLTVMIIRCLYLTHVSVTQQKTELMERVNGTEVEELQMKLLEISKITQEASANYLQAPLSVLFVVSFIMFVFFGMQLYKNHNYSSFIIWTVLFGTAMVTPLWLLTRIEKFYLWTLRNELHRNTIMPQTARTYLVSTYDTIAPRASIFGIYITRGRVASVIIAILGAIIPKIGMFIYEHV
jgi:hypothetical protein